MTLIETGAGMRCVDPSPYWTALFLVVSLAVYDSRKGAAWLPELRGPKMLLTVKALQGRECSLQVSPDERISSLKRLVSEKLNVPVSQQRLLFKGKALADEHRLSDYSIGPESKLNLVIKPLEKASPEDPSSRAGFPQTSTIWHMLAQILSRHYSVTDTEKVLEQMQKDYERSLRLLSLDDIERLATRLLHPEVAEAVEMGFLD